MLNPHIHLLIRPHLTLLMPLLILPLRRPQQRCILAPPLTSLVSLFLILTNVGVLIATPEIIACPFASEGSSDISSLLALSMLWAICCWSVGLIIRIVIWVMHCESESESSLLGLWEIRHTPTPNFLPSESIVFRMLFYFASPLCGANLCTSSMTTKTG